MRSYVGVKAIFVSIHSLYLGVDFPNMQRSRGLVCLVSTFVAQMPQRQAALDDFLDN